MKLHQWINAFPREKRKKERKRLARCIGKSESYVRSLANGNRPITPELAKDFDKATKGGVPKHESSDIFDKPETSGPSSSAPVVNEARP